MPPIVPQQGEPDSGAAAPPSHLATPDSIGALDSIATADGIDPDLSSVDAIKNLIADAKLAASSEVALVKACAAVVLASIKSISIWAVVALLVVFVALLALAIGLMIALAQVTGALIAALIVPGVLLLIAGVAGLIIKGSVKSLQNAIGSLKS